MNIVFDEVNARVVTENDNHVFYTDIFIKGSDYECPNEVVEKVVSMFNEGKDLCDIDEYLLNAPCTTEAREVIVKALYTLYDNLTNITTIK